MTMAGMLATVMTQEDTMAAAARNMMTEEDFGGRDQAVQHIARLQFAVDEHTHDHGVHHADHACLGSGKLTAAQTNQNEQGQQQRPQAIADGVQDLTLGLTGCGGQVVPLCNKNQITHRARDM